MSVHCIFPLGDATNQGTYWSLCPSVSENILITVTLVSSYMRCSFTNLLRSFGVRWQSWARVQVNSICAPIHFCQDWPIAILVIGFCRSCCLLSRSKSVHWFSLRWRRGKLRAVSVIIGLLNISHYKLTYISCDLGIQKPLGLKWRHRIHIR